MHRSIEGKKTDSGYDMTVRSEKKSKIKWLRKLAIRSKSEYKYVVGDLGFKDGLYFQTIYFTLRN